MCFRDWASGSWHNLSLIFACRGLKRISDFSRVLDDGLLLLAVMVCFMATEYDAGGRTVPGIATSFSMRMCTLTMPTGTPIHLVMLKNHFSFTLQAQARDIIVREELGGTFTPVWPARVAHCQLSDAA